MRIQTINCLSGKLYVYPGNKYSSNFFPICTSNIALDYGTYLASRVGVQTSNTDRKTVPVQIEKTVIVLK